MTVQKFEAMIGKTMVAAVGGVGDDIMRFRSQSNDLFVFSHHQSCCETVEIVDVIGDLDDLIGSPILEAEEVSSDGAAPPEISASYTWTFYKFATVRGSVTVRWLGTSNGCYSESVDYEHTPAVLP